MQLAIGDRLGPLAAGVVMQLLLHRIICTLPFVSTFLAMIVVFFSFFMYPRGSNEWQEFLSGGEGWSQVGERAIVTKHERKAFRAYKFTLLSLACIFEGILLPRRFGSPLVTLKQPQVIDPYLPASIHLLDCYRFLFSLFDFVVWAASVRNPWVNPGFGMYGWTVVWDMGFPEQNTISHMSLGALAAIFMTAWRLSRGVSLEAHLYPIYDSKHAYGSSHMANLGGEWMPPYIFLSSTLTWWFWERFPSDSRPSWSFARYFDRQVLVMLGIAIVKTTVDMLNCRQCWDSPLSRHDESGEGCYVFPEQVNPIWRSVTLSLYFSIAALLFIYVEYTLWQGGRKEIGQPSTELVTLYSVTSESSIAADAVHDAGLS